MKSTACPSRSGRRFPADLFPHSKDKSPGNGRHFLRGVPSTFGNSWRNSRRPRSGDEIKDYLRVQKDIYLATPKGIRWKEGSVPPRKKRNPISGNAGFLRGRHLGQPGNPHSATAEGIVSHSGWTPPPAQRGLCGVLEHGAGFHHLRAQQRNAVKRGEKVKRGRRRGVCGSTGKSTGPMCIMKYGRRGGV